MLSIIVLSYNSSNRLEGVCESIDILMQEQGIQYEIVIIDDGSPDDSYSKALQLERGKPAVRAYQLSKNYGSFNAIFAGLTLVKGKCATVVPDDEQLPYGTVIEMYRLWENGNKIIIPHRITREDGFIRKTTAGLFYWLINLLTDVRFPKGGADSFLIDREIIDIINQKIHPLDTSVIAEIIRLGFDPYYVPYQRIRQATGNTRWNTRKRLKYFFDTLRSGSVWPMRIFLLAGILFFILGTFLFISALTWLSGSHFVLEIGCGPVLIVSSVIFSTGIILFALGMTGEYMWNIYKKLQGRQGYIIRKKDDQIR